MMRRDKKITKERLSKLDKMLEESAKRFRESRIKMQEELSVPGDKIRIERMVELIISKKMPGLCDNICDSDLKKGVKRVAVKAGDNMCSVGIVRRGRNWGDYGGVFCGQCPYFIPNKPIEEC